MNLRKHMVLIVGGGVALVLVVITLGVLLKYRSQYSRVDNELQASLTRLTQLNNMDPFPSQANVEIVNANQKKLSEYFDSLMQKLQQGQVREEDMRPAEYLALLEQTVRGLTDEAGMADVILPERFAFGFDRYFIEGELPNPEDIPRLVVQLRSIEALAAMLFESKVSEVEEIERQIFEAKAAEEEPEEVAGRAGRSGRAGRVSRRGRTAAVAGSTPGVPVVPKKKDYGLYKKERVKVKLTARESAMWDLLDRLGSSPLVVVVTHIDLESQGNKNTSVATSRRGAAASGPGARPARPGGGPARASEGEAVLSHDERIVAGREEITVSLEVDIYRFELSESEEETEGERSAS